MIRERLHYENLKVLTDKHFDIIRYLYMRLNIIDGKAGYLLRTNTLTGGLIGVLLSLIAKSGDQNGPPTFTDVQTCFLAVAIVANVYSFIISFAMGELEYDRITTPPLFFNQIRISDALCKHLETLPCPEKRRFVGNYSKDETKIILEQSGWLPRREAPHSLKEYEDLFFKITIARVRMLRNARAAVGIAVLFSMLFVLDLARHPPTNGYNVLELRLKIPQ